MSYNLLQSLQQSFTNNQEKVCIVDLVDNQSGPHRALTYSQVEQSSLGLAAELHNRFNSISRRPVIGILARNSSDWVIADLACLLSGSTSLPLPLAFSRAQAEHLAARCDGFLVDAAGARTLKEKWGLDLDDRSVLRLGEAPQASVLDWPTEQRDDWTCKVIHTSGTTNRPKGVQLKISAIGQVLNSLSEGMPRDAHRSYLSVVPLSLLLEQITAVYMPILCGGTVHFLAESTPLLGEPDATADKIIRWLLAVQPTAMTIPPMMITRFNEIIDADEPIACELYKYLSTRVHITCGGASVSTDIMRSLESRGVHVFQGYGLSENASVVSMNTSQHQRIGSVGKPLPHVSVRVGADATIEINSPSLFDGYSGDDPSACSFTADGWLDTGDLGSLDEEGYLYVHGRKKNVICLPNGRNVCPEQVEVELRRHEGVQDAAVFLHNEHGVVALIVGEVELEQANLAAWCKEEFSDIERPSAFWIIPPTDPAISELYTVTGRPKRAEIASAYSRYRTV